MIVEWILSVASSVGGLVASWFPDWTPPEPLIHVDDQINSVFLMGEGLAPWADWSYVAVIAAIPITIWVGGLTVKAARVLISHLPWVGGRG